MQRINKDILRVLDANFNRAKEAIRVCEDILRFNCNCADITKGFKVVRHQISRSLKLLGFKEMDFLAKRNIIKDVGKPNFSLEFRRSSIADIFFANVSRIKESIRVMEEFSKLINKRAAADFKKLRYRIYQLEKETIKKFPTLSNPR